MKKILLILSIILITGSTYYFASQDFDPQEGAPEITSFEECVEAGYPVRWTDYAIMDDLSQLDDFLDAPINDLSVLQQSFEEDSLRLVDRLEDEVYAKTCRDYLYYKERGFGPYTTMEINQSTYFDLACCHLQLFKQAEGSRESYLSDFNLARDWQDLPARELFSLYQMGTLAETEDDVFSSEIKEANEFYVYGENLEITHEYGYNFSFQLYLFGWGDFDHDGIEDILLYTKIQTALWNFTPGDFVIISKKDEDSPIEMESIYSHSYDGEFDKRLSVKRKSPLQLESSLDWQTYRNEEFGYEIRYPLDGNLREIYSGLPEVPSESNVEVNIENVLIDIHSWENKDSYETLEELISGEKKKQEKGFFTVFSTIPNSYQEFLVGGEPAIKWSTYHDTVGKIGTTTIVLKGNYFYDIGGKGDAFISNFGDKEEGIYNLFLSTFKFINSEGNM